jgi:RimJ/RimL family protein N-acetyltransferase
MVSGEMQLIKAVDKDIPEIAALAEKIWKVHYPPIIGMAQVEYMLNIMYSTEALLNQINAGQNFYFIRKEGKNIGYFGVSNDVPTELFIHKFYIDSESQGKGIGMQAFHLLIDMYPQCATARLTVNRHNYKSINFYFKAGFVISEVKDFDIGEGYVMNDFIMIWKRK